MNSSKALICDSVASHKMQNAPRPEDNRRPSSIQEIFLVELLHSTLLGVIVGYTKL